MKLSLIVGLLLLSTAAFALPLVSVKDQLREDLWHSGIKAPTLPKSSQVSLTKEKPRLNEEVERALIKYKL